MKLYHFTDGWMPLQEGGTFTIETRQPCVSAAKKGVYFTPEWIYTYAGGERNYNYLQQENKYFPIVVVIIDVPEDTQLTINSEDEMELCIEKNINLHITRIEREIRVISPGGLWNAHEREFVLLYCTV